MSVSKPDYKIENALRERGFLRICGVDEAGRGPLCGPVFAGACILPPDIQIAGLNDSKKLSVEKRENLFDVICEKAIAYSVASASVEVIDELNILEATLLAMRRAVDGLCPQPDYVLVDGNVCRGFDIPSQFVIHGDALSCSIAAASVLAKVSRDRLCVELDRLYPGYGIAEHKGYGTKKHIEALIKLGPTPAHRKKFIRFLKNGDTNRY